MNFLLTNTPILTGENVLGGVVLVFAVVMLCIFLKPFEDKPAKPAVANAANSGDSGDSGVSGKPADSDNSSKPPRYTEGQVDLNNVDERTAAMLMAIVADEMKVAPERLKFISVREVL